LLVAPDRLGVLHDVGAATAGAKHLRVPISGIGLVEPERHDPSTGQNADALRRLMDVPVFGAWVRAPVDALEHVEATAAVVQRWLR